MLIFFEDFSCDPEWGEVRFVAQAIQPGSGGGGVPSGPAGGDLSGTYPDPLFGAGIDRVDGVNEVRTLTITGSPTGGSFTITFAGFTSAAIPFNATAAQVAAALLAVPSIGNSGVACTGGPLPGSPVLIERVGPWAAATSANTFSTTNSFTGGTAPASSIAITTAAVPFSPNPTATQIGAAGVYLAAGDAIKMGNAAGTSWVPVLSRDNNVVVFRGGNLNPVLIADANGRVGFGMGVVPSTYSGWEGAVVIRNAQANLGGMSGVTEVTIVAGDGQLITGADLMRFLDAAGVFLGARINKSGYFIIGKTAVPADADLLNSEGNWSLSSGMPIWKGKDAGGVVQSFNAADHSARHENGGADEISIAGLDGTSTELAAHLSDATDAHDASAISVIPFSTIAATQLQAALEEIVAEATAGAPTSADYLVGTANAGLSAEIVVGTTPGGELGGTWATPTVDATHSGSSHAGVQAAAEATAAAALSAHVTDASDAHDASAISFVPTGSIGATDVQAAIVESQRPMLVALLGGGASVHIWTNMPAGETILFNTNINRWGMDLTEFTQMRWAFYLTANGSASALLKVQYATTIGGAYAAIDGGTGTEITIAAGSGTRLSATWVNLVAGAKADVFLRVAGVGGDGVADPGFGTMFLEFR